MILLPPSCSILYTLTTVNISFFIFEVGVVLALQSDTSLKTLEHYAWLVSWILNINSAYDSSIIQLWGWINSSCRHQPGCACGQLKSLGYIGMFCLSTKSLIVNLCYWAFRPKGGLGIYSYYLDSPLHFNVVLEHLFNAFCYPAFEGKGVKWTERGYDENVFETLDVSLHSFEIREWKLFAEYPLCFRHFPLTSHLIIQESLKIDAILTLWSRNLNFYFKLLSMVIMQFFLLFWLNIISLTLYLLYRIA